MGVGFNFLTYHIVRRIQFTHNPRWAEALKLPAFHWQRLQLNLLTSHTYFPPMSQALFYSHSTFGSASTSSDPTLGRCFSSHFTLGGSFNLLAFHGGQSFFGFNLLIFHAGQRLQPTLFSRQRLQLVHSTLDRCFNLLISHAGGRVNSCCALGEAQLTHIPRPSAPRCAETSIYSLSTLGRGFKTLNRH